MTYYGPTLYTPHELRKLAIEEFVASEGVTVAVETLARTGNRVTALAHLEYRWSDASLDGPVEELVRRAAIAHLLTDANPTERDAYEATQAFGVDSFERATAAAARALTYAPLPEAIR